MRPAHALIVVENMSYTYDTRVRRIAAALTANGIRVTVICPRFPGDPHSERGARLHVRFYPQPTFGDGFFGHVLEYLYAISTISVLTVRVAMREGFDSIHICNPPDILFPVGAVCRLAGKRFIFDQHDLVPELFEARFGISGGFAARVLRLAQRCSFATATHALVTNETARRRVVALNHDFAHKTSVVGNGPALSETPGTAVARAAKSDGVIRLGYVGNINPQDGVQLLVHVMRQIRHVRRRRDIRLVCVGDGSALPDVRSLAGALDVAGAIDFLGRLPPDAALRALASCDICVQPDPKNAFTDSCSMVKSLEYMLLAKPIVTFELAETRAACGAAALYVQEPTYEAFAEAVLRLADDPALRMGLGRIGRARIERRLAWEHIAPALLAAYGFTQHGRPSAPAEVVRATDGEPAAAVARQ